MPDKTNKNLTPRELDILDGVQQPTLPSNVKPAEVQFTPNVNADGSFVDTTDTSESVQDVEQLLNTLRTAIEDRKTFDPMTGTSSIAGGTLASTGVRLTDSEYEQLLADTRERIDSVRDKANRIKNAIDARQKADPTVVSFNASENTLLKRGMRRVFRSKADNITFQQYKAAIEARKLLSDRLAKEQMKDAGALMGNPNAG